MYTMVMMMAMSGSADTTGFGHKMRGGCDGMGCNGAAVVVASGCSGCTGAAPAAVASAGCQGSASCYGSTSCNGCGGGSGFLGLRGHFSRKMRGGSSCSGYAAPSAGCTGCSGYAAPAVADCCGAAASYSTGCVGSVITGGMPGAMITEGPAAMPAPTTGAVEKPKPMDKPTPAPTPAPKPKPADKVGDGV